MSDDGPTMLHAVAVPWDSFSEVLWTDWRSGLPVREVFRRGAFRKALEREDLDVVAALDHSDGTRDCLGRSISGTLRMYETDLGLEYDAELPNTSAAHDLVELVRRGDVFGSSFWFTVREGDDYLRHHAKPDMILREVIEVDGLHDVSPLLRPAYRETNVQVRGNRGESEIQTALDRWHAEACERERELDLLEIEVA